MGNNTSKKNDGIYSHTYSKRWKKDSKPRDYWKAVSDLDTEFKIPDHLQYRSCDSVEEDLFTTDTRTPCLIHLHQLTRSDLSGVVRGAQAYAKPQRPKSFDPNILLDERTNTASVLPAKSTVNITASADLTGLFNPQGLLPTPQKKMQMVNAQHKGELITVDTSGTQFDRRVNLRRSQRATTTGNRKKNQHKLKERHKTLTALPDYVSSELGLHAMNRQSSLYSDVNSLSSFLGDGSVASADSSLSPRDQASNDVRIVDPKELLSSPVRRRLKNRHSMSVVNSVPVSPRVDARLSLHKPTEQPLSTFPRNSADINKSNKVYMKLNNGHLSDEPTNSLKQESFLRDKSIAAEDRISSGFWSGTESCRHSTTSEIVGQHNGFLSKVDAVFTDENQVKVRENGTCGSSLSLNSRLSTLGHSLSSSVASLPSSPANSTPTPDDSLFTQRSDPVTPRHLNFTSPAGTYNFMNPNYVEKPVSIAHFSSPVNPLILGTRRGQDGNIRDDLESFDNSTSPYNANIRREKFQKQHVHHAQHHVCISDTTETDTSCRIQPTSVATPNNTSSVRSTFPISCSSNNEKSEFLIKSERMSQSDNANDLQAELKARLNRRNKTMNESSKKPSPPRRHSSLRRPKKEEKAYMEPLKNRYVQSPNSLPNAKPKQSFPYPPPPSLVMENQPNISSPNLESRLSCSSFETDSERSSNSDSPSPLRVSYQPSKTLASCLQSRRPATMYNFHISAQPLPESASSRPNSLSEASMKVTSPLSPTSVSSKHSPSNMNNQTKAITFASPRPTSTLAKSSSSGLPNKELSSTEKRDAGAGFTVSPIQLKTAALTLNRISRIEEASECLSRTVESSPTSQPDIKTSTQSTAIERSNTLVFTNDISRSDVSSSSPASHSRENEEATESPLPSTGQAVNQNKPTTAAVKNEIPKLISPGTTPNKALPSAKPPTPRKKPSIRPKPASLKLKSTSNDEICQVGVKSRQVKNENANLRAAFFASLSSPVDKSDAAEQMKDKKVEEVVNGEMKIGGVESKSHETVLKRTSEKVPPDLAGKAAGSDSDKENENINSTATEDKNKQSPDNLNNIEKNEELKHEIDLVDTKIIDDISNDDSHQSIVKENAKSPLKAFPVEVEPAMCIGINGVECDLDNIEGPVETPDVFSSPRSTPQKFHFGSAMHRPRASYSVLPSENGVLSPTVFNYERKNNFRYSTSSLERRRKPQSGSTSRDDFKTLLLQNLSKSGSGSYMSATEKLRTSLQSPKSSSETEDVADGKADGLRSQIVSVGDIRAAMSTSRPGRRPNRLSDHRRSYAATTNYSNKKHPPVSMSGRYSARSRTPTRPMMAISEDVENDLSPEKPDDLLQRPKSVGDF